MSYLAIARKWRPVTFEEIAGQRHVTRTLCNAIRMERIHHAFLFTGPRGVGKTTAARVLARALNCVQGPTTTPCGECALCKGILSGSSPDVIEIDGASNNSVDDIRELREGLRYLPSQGRYRIYIIDEVHMLTRGAFNALLKTLEEPPPHVIFMFATTEAQKIPETILSRVQRFDFKRIPASVVVERLRTICQADEIHISDAALSMIARAGEGSMRDAQSLLDQVVSFGGSEVGDSQVVDLLGLVDRSLLYLMLEGLVEGEPSRCLEAIAAVHDHGYELNQFTTELLELLRNAALVVLSTDSHRFLDIPADEFKRLQELAGGQPVEVFARWFDALMEVHDRVTRSSHPRLVLEMAVARLCTIRPALGMDQLVARLEDLDRKMRHRGARPGAPEGGSGGSGPGRRPSFSAGNPPGPGSVGRGTRGVAPAGPATPKSPARSPAPRRPTSAGRASSGPPAWMDEAPPPEPGDGDDDGHPGPPPSRVGAAPEQSGAPLFAPVGGAPSVATSPFKPPSPPPPRAAPPLREPPLREPPLREPPLREPPHRGPERETLFPVPAAEPGTASPEEDLEACFQQLLDALPADDLVWDLVQNHSTLAQWSQGVLHVEFSSSFHLEQVRERLQGPEFRALAEAVFPGFRKVVAQRRSDDVRLTRREKADVSRAAYLQTLRETAEAHPVVCALRERLGATLERVIPPPITESAP